MPGFEPQTDVILDVVPCDAALETAPTITELCLLGVPDNAGFQVELKSVSFTAVTLPVDAANNINCDIEWVDDSAADAVADLAAAFAMDDDATARVITEVWRGSQLLDPGDTVNAEFDVTTPTTASEGAAFIVEYRILKRSGG